MGVVGGSGGARRSRDPRHARVQSKLVLRGGRQEEQGRRGRQLLKTPNQSLSFFISFTKQKSNPDNEIIIKSKACFVVFFCFKTSISTSKQTNKHKRMNSKSAVTKRILNPKKKESHQSQSTRRAHDTHLFILFLLSFLVTI